MAEETTDRLDEKALQRVSGPAWEVLRPVFVQASRSLLSAAPETTSELTTIYVKFCTSSSRMIVFAVIWLKTSKELVVGLSLPEEYQCPELGPGPSGTKYKGLTKYLTIPAGKGLPARFDEWAQLAFLHVAKPQEGQ